MVKIIKNYEIIENTKNIVVTYSLLNFDDFKNGEEVKIYVSENNGQTSLEAFSSNAQCQFKDFPKNKIKNLSEKKLIIAGFSSNNELERANVVSEINIVKKPKLK